MLDLLSSARLITAALQVNATPDLGFAADEVDWPTLLDHADAHSLTPLLWSQWQGLPGARRLPLAIQDRLARALHDNESRQANVCAELLEISSLLTQVNVPHLVLKGYPLAERLYQSPAHRVIYDHDFLVPAELAEGGHHALLQAGFRRLPAKDEWVEKHLPSVWRNEGYTWDGYLFDPDYPRPVELHLRLWEDNWRGLTVKALPNVWRDAVKRSVAGREMLVLSDEDTLIHLAMHFAGHLVEREARLNQLLDLARFASASMQSLRWQTVLTKSRVAGVARFVYASLFLAHEIYASPLPPTEVWIELAAHTPVAFRGWLTEQGVTDVLTSNYRERHKGKEYALTFLAAQSPLEKWGIVRFAALPPTGQLIAKYNLRHRWQVPLMYPRYFFDRLKTYAVSLTDN